MLEIGIVIIFGFWASCLIILREIVKKGNKKNRAIIGDNLIASFTQNTDRKLS